MISFRAVTLALLMPVVPLGALGAVYAVLDARGQLDPEISFFKQFDLGEEHTVAAWYAALLLFVACALLAANAMAERARGRPIRHWIALSAIFLLMSCDEVVGLHERLSVLAAGLADMSPIFYYPWIGVALVCVPLIGAYFVPFLLRLPGATRWRFIVAGLVYVGSSLGLETIESLAASYGQDHITPFLVLIEECGEMVGIVLFIRALLLHLGSIGLAVRRDPAPAGYSAAVAVSPRDAKMVGATGIEPVTPPV